MFTYYFELALRSLKRSPGLTVLMMLSIGIGVASTTTAWSVFRAVSGDPIPWKSSKLFVPQLDIWGPSGRGGDGEPPAALDYADAMALMHAHRATRQSAMFLVSPAVLPRAAGQHPINVDGHAVYSEFFSMLDVPFQYGSGWSVADDTQQAAVVVISDNLNQQVFGGGNSVGKTLNMDGRDYRVVGVAKAWNPQPAFYDIYDTGGFSSSGDDVFLPFQRAVAINLGTSGRINCNEPTKEPGFIGLQHSSCAWISYMVQLDDAAAVRAYRRYLDDYASQQQRAGHFSWAPNNRLRDLPAFLDNQQVVPNDTKVSLLVALGLLLVGVVNTVGLLLAKFLRRSGEIGVRRALGASRGAIYAQFFTEAGVIGVAGGALGLLLTALGVTAIGVLLPKNIADLARLDGELLLGAIVLAVLATLLAGLYPIFRASRVQPAWQLKSN